jgi:hypothetical protein
MVGALSIIRGGSIVNGGRPFRITTSCQGKLAEGVVVLTVDA